jgi:Uma2 family endonuclease
MITRMSVAQRKPITLAQFLDWEERQEMRFEFDGLEPVAMAGATYAHEAIGGALRALLREKLRGGPCQALGPTMKVEAAGRIRYPDAFVYGKPVPPDETVIREPVVVFEVVSPSTSRTDRIVKLREYRETDSIHTYVILEQDSVAATVFTKQDREWIAWALTEGDTLSAPEIGVDLVLADIYADVALTPLETAAEG